MDTVSSVGLLISNLHVFSENFNNTSATLLLFVWLGYGGATCCSLHHVWSGML
jgi:hypothetical protein